MDFLRDNCTLEALTDDILRECRPFRCSDTDLNDFFQNDALEYARYQMGKTYCFRLVDDPTVVVAYFTLANDSIRIFDLPNSRKNKMWRITHRRKMLKRYPGVLIGRLAVDEEFARRGIGSEAIRIICAWFMDDGTSKTGCRFAIVDAKNEEGVLNFYASNGFKLLFPNEKDEDVYFRPDGQREEANEPLRTRLMFLDLLTEWTQGE